MQMVINIPDEWEKRIEYNRRPNTIECGELVESIWNGKILPKGHGRLIDGDKLESRMKIGYCIVREAPTIIEADKEGSGDA